MKGNLLNPTTETLPAASLITLPVISSPLQLYRLYTMVTIALPFIFRRWDCSVYGGTVGLKCGSAPIYIFPLFQRSLYFIINFRSTRKGRFHKAKRLKERSLYFAM